ncbi:serine/threonine-protein kinase [Polyangium aurulentum]|uniref:serine/threonine-protein kinase n=1 Tax=Polyangium aurulentum TaxID=2567896 RepID=UPI00146C5E49|nr:serine/threonine-protein kinase [Polyangium aurulentum]UQA58144.1 serine/threonine protein kinase [Polyangium aurulentum]
MTSPVPTLPSLAKYELLEEIGHGGMATVYRARDPRLGREVAIKIIHKHLRENSEVGARFVAEARAAAKLRHPGIVEVYDVSAEEDGDRYLVVELLRGTTLRKILQQHRDMPAEIGAAIVLALCEALEHAHASGIIHRDVKPENVLVELPQDRVQTSNRSAPSRPDRESDASDTPAPLSAQRPVSSRNEGADPGDSRVSRKSRRGDLGVIIKLTDFGIAKMLDAQGVTSTGQVLGSPAHMAPEQIEAGEVDGRTDVFALGVLMYECLVGHLPFEGKNPAQVLRRVLEGHYPAADRERSTVGGRWSRIIAGALARTPAERTESPGKLGEQIRTELEALGITDPSAEIAAYFEDPAGHAEALRALLVPRLVARGERARKARDVQGAAADFNRALALAPNDLSILKRVTSLTSSNARRLLARRLAAIVAGSAVLGFAAYGIARWHKSQPTSLETEALPRPQTVAPSGPTAAPVADVAPRDTKASVTSPLEHAVRTPRKVSPSPAVTSAPAIDRATPRKVVFEIIPKGASLVLDGREVNWFANTFSLAPGPHSVEISVPTSKCCEPKSLTAQIAPSDDPNEVQRFVWKLEPRPATVALSGAPANAQLACSEIGLAIGPGSIKGSAKLPDVQWSGRCDFTPPSAEEAPRRATVTLRAGEVNQVPWPP